MAQTTIYGLQDPRTKEFRYIGLSTDAVNRLKQHIIFTAADDGRAGTAAKREWFKDLADNGLEPYLVVLEVTNESASRACEKHWIAKLASEGEPLTNREARDGRFTPPESLGSAIFEFAEKRGALGVNEIVSHIERRTGSIFGRASVSSYVVGRTDPKPAFTLKFAQAFELNHVEATRLSWLFAYKEEPPAEILEQARKDMEAGKPLPYKPLVS